MLLRRRPPSVAPPLAVLVVLAAPVGLLAGCSGGSSSDGASESAASPEEVLAAAKTTLDETSGVELSLSTASLPEGVTGITSAVGTLTSAPAFEGQITVELAGAGIEVPIVAVDDEVYAQLPLTPEFQVLDPADYGAPDPARLLDPEDGVSALLTETTDVVAGETVRGGANNDEILTEYSGTVTDAVMTNIIPSAQGTFDVDYTVTEDDELREAVLTGVFYPDSEEMTYTVDLENYGTERDIVAP